MKTSLRKKPKIGIISLGCARNLVDSEGILGRLSKKGFFICDTIDKADIGIINTCAFIQEAKQESIDIILDGLELKNQGRLKKLIVSGCLAQRYSQDLLTELNGIDALAGIYEFNHCICRYPLTPSHYAYVKICEGCDNNCSYCVIPKIKGRFKSRSSDSIIDQITHLDKQGVAEINLIGQDISVYGKDLDGGLNLSGLLKDIIRVGNQIKWIRLLYLHPAHLSDTLIDLIANQPLVCKYIDLPIQHINQRILKFMNRGISRSQIISLIDKVRRQISSVCLRTSIIVGFPGETDKEFKELIDFIKQMRFERLGAFIYSAEENTLASKLPNQIPDNVKRERLQILMSTQQEVSRDLLKASLGQTVEVLIDQEDSDNPGVFMGRTQDMAPEVDGLIYVRSRRRIKPGTFLDVKITDSLEYDLIGIPS